MEALILLDRNSMLVQVKVRNKKTGAAVTSATTKTVTLYDRRGREVEGTGVSWPLVLSSQGDVDGWGVWEVTLPPAISNNETGGNVKVGDELTLEVDIIETTTTLRFYSRPRVTVKERVD